MKVLEPLFEFMPYGAPELLQSRRERLASATLLSSVAVAALVLAAGGLASRAAVPPIRVPASSFDAHDVLPPPALNPLPPAAPVPRVRPANVAEGVPVPVAEPDVPLVFSPGPAADAGPAGPQPAGSHAEGASATLCSECLPAPGEYVRVEELPEPVTQIKPPYPEIAREAGVEGLVIVQVLVGKDGRVLDVRLDAKRQVPLLNDAALAAAREWRFTPALANGRPVAVWTAIPFHFRLHE